MDPRQRAAAVWRAFVAALPFGRRRNQEPARIDQTGLTSWAAVEGSELVSWFGVHEVGRRPAPDGGATVSLKPGGYQESVDIVADLTGGDRVRRARLILARSWVDHPQTAPFALDLTKSAVPILAPASDTARRFADRLMAELGTMRVIMRAPGPPTPTSADPEIESLVAAYLGRQPRAAHADGGGIISIENMTEAGRAVVTITVSAPPTQ